jgi:hypothetical protein
MITLNECFYSLRGICVFAAGLGRLNGSRADGRADAETSPRAALRGRRGGPATPLSRGQKFDDRRFGFAPFCTEVGVASGTLSPVVAVLSFVAEVFFLLPVLRAHCFGEHNDSESTQILSCFSQAQRRAGLEPFSVERRVRELASALPVANQRLYLYHASRPLSDLCWLVDFLVDTIPRFSPSP